MEGNVIKKCSKVSTCTITNYTAVLNKDLCHLKL